MNALEIYKGSDGKRTQGMYKALNRLGPAGIIATNLFRACKCSERAKEYSGQWKGPTYDRKQWSVDNLCQELTIHGKALGIVWGWKKDPNPPKGFPWVLYVEIPERGQCSYHAATRGEGPNYPGEWSGKHNSPSVAISFCQHLLNGHVIAMSVKHDPTDFSPEERAEFEKVCKPDPYQGKPIQGELRAGWTF